MGKTITHNLKLTVADIKDTIKDINFLKDNLKVAGQEIVESLVESGGEIASQVNANAPSSNMQASTVVSRITENGTSGYIALVGPGAVYDEFGTGDQGATNPHPAKDFASRPLNPYNSGETIRIDKNGAHYWIYKPMANRPYFDKHGRTHGIPAGKQIFTASVHVRTIKDKVVKEKVNESLQYLRK